VPAFIVHTADDQIVNVRNSLSLANAYAEKKIPFEMHIFKSAPHGMSVAKKHIACGYSAYVNSHNAKWVELAAEWMENL
jgi:dipeptidyl aminopeptidase/acylaminoacyl peptidase